MLAASLLLALIAGLTQCSGQAQAAGSSANGGSSNGLQCQRIAVSACQGLGYNMTALPNLAGHTNQLEAELQVSTSPIYSPAPHTTCARFLRDDKRYFCVAIKTILDAYVRKPKIVKKSQAIAKVNRLRRLRQSQRRRWRLRWRGGHRRICNCIYGHDWSWSWNWSRSQS